MNKFIFDVDGTLTPSRETISKEYAEFFLSFCQSNDVYLVTGSDKEKTIEQLGSEIYNQATTAFNCSGNDVWQGKKLIYRSAWVLPAAAHNHLRSVLFDSQCPTKTGEHFEVRPGSVNFSTVGRAATKEQRQEYIEFDERTQERARIVEIFNTCFGSKLNCFASIGGETGIDIVENGCDKRQILKQIDFDPKKDKLIFFGDKTYPGGNDYPLAAEIYTKGLGRVIQVKKWHDTFETLSYFQEAKIAA